MFWSSGQVGYAKRTIDNLLSLVRTAYPTGLISDYFEPHYSCLCGRLKASGQEILWRGRRIPQKSSPLHRYLGFIADGFAFLVPKVLLGNKLNHSMWLLHSLHVRPQTHQFSSQIFISPFEMINPANDGFSLCSQCRYYQSS